MVERRLLRWSELRPLIGRRPAGVGRLERRLAGAATIEDLRLIGRRRTPRAVFDYVDGAAEAEESIRRAREAFRDVEFVPSVLQDVSAVDTSTTILGGRSALPLVFGPTGFTRMMHTEGERAVAAAASRLGIPYALSTMGTTSPEDLAADAPDLDRWFQLYLWRDREGSRELVARASAAGFRVIVLTVDTPVAGARHRDSRNGLTIPPALTWKTLVDGALHPAWWFDLLTTPPLEFATFSSFHGTIAELVDRMFDPAVTFEDLAWLRETWDGPLVVKGIATVEDARKVVDAGADAIVVSNHGGRQLDRSPNPLERLPEVVDAVGDRSEVYLDGGILTGADVVAAVALGARACLVGRAYLYGLMAGGRKGVERAGAILSREVERTMQLLGVRSVDELDRSRIRIRGD